MTSENPDSALIWFPAIEAAGLPVPKTIFVPYSHQDCLSLFDNEDSAEFHRTVKLCTEAAESIGWPVFIRSDLTSAKHNGPKAYKSDSPNTIAQVLFETLEDNEMKLWMERNGPKAFMVRQFLTLQAPFTAFHGLPISREWRFFADGEKCHCYHPYWPVEALEGYVDADGTGTTPWVSMLAEMHRIPEEFMDLRKMAIEAARACGGSAWSVDFCQDDTSKWWLLDMATMKSSWHWEGCKNAK